MRKPVFYDDTGKRWRKSKIILLLVLFMSSIIVSLQLGSLYGIWDNPFITVMNLAIWQAIKAIFISYIVLTIMIGICRMVILIFFSLRQRRKYRNIRQYEGECKNYLKKYRPTVSVIVPVFNEQVVIRNTISAILNNDYPVDEILIIDDGSKDHTAAITRKLFRYFPKVQLIRKLNEGKASALNKGIQRAVGEIVITIDADSIIHKQTIGNLVSHFKNPEIAAVSGNCKIGNRKNQLTTWQHIEYVTSNNLEKRALDELNCMTIVPGATGAWRKSVVEQVGYYEDDTLAEDADLTLRVMNEGYKIVYDEYAISHVECPETTRQFVTQRFRWSFGIMQSLWKNKKSIYQTTNKSLKYFSVPSMLFSYLLYLTVPLIDIAFIFALITGTKSIYLFVLFFYMLDVINSLLAFWLEKEKMKPLLFIIIQRIYYRYVIGYITWKVIIMALKGNLVSWGFLQRSGNNNSNNID